MRRSRFTLGPRPQEATLASPKRKLPKYQPANTTRVQNISPKKEDVVERHVSLEEEEEEEPLEMYENPSTSGLPRAQLELEYKAVLGERDMLINQLSRLIETQMSQ